MVHLRIECRCRPRLTEDTGGFERRTGDAESRACGAPYAGRYRTLVAGDPAVRVAEAWSEWEAAGLPDDAVCAPGRAPHPGGGVRFTFHAVIRLRPAVDAGGEARGAQHPGREARRKFGNIAELPVDTRLQRVRGSGHAGELQRHSAHAGVLRVSIWCRSDSVVTPWAGVPVNAIDVAAGRATDPEVRVVANSHGHEAIAARTHRQVVVVGAAIGRELVVIGDGHVIPPSRSRALTPLAENSTIYPRVLLRCSGAIGSDLRLELERPGVFWSAGKGARTPRLVIGNH